MSMDHIDRKFFTTLINACYDSKNVDKSKSVGAVMAMISRTKKINSRYPRIIKFLGKIECDSELGKLETAALVKQFVIYHNLYEYLIKEVPSIDVSYWKQLLTKRKYKEPANSNDLWSNIFGKDVVNIKGIYMSDEGNILKREEKKLARDETSLRNELNESDAEGFDLNHKVDICHKIYPQSYNEASTLKCTVLKDVELHSGTSANISIDHIDKDFFKALLCTACDSRNVNKSKNVGTAMTMIYEVKKFGVDKRVSRYPKIMKFLGKNEYETKELEKQFMFYHNLYEYLMKEVPSTDVSYWKQLLTEKEYIEPAESNDLWSNIFGKEVVNIKGIYMSDDGNILKQQEKQLDSEESNFREEFNESDEEGFDQNFFENEFFSDDDQNFNEINSEKDLDLGCEKQKDSGNLQTHIKEDNISVKKTYAGTQIEIPLNNVPQIKIPVNKVPQIKIPVNKVLHISQSQDTTAAKGTLIEIPLNKAPHKSQSLNSIASILESVAANPTRYTSSLRKLVNQEICLHKCASGKILCLWCSVNLTGENSVKEHLAGPFHTQNIPEENAEEGLQEVTPRRYDTARGRTFWGRTRCIWCNVVMNCENDVQQHIAGSKHRNNAVMHRNNLANNITRAPTNGTYSPWPATQETSVTTEATTNWTYSPGPAPAREETSLTTEVLGNTIPVLNGRVVESKEKKKKSRGTTVIDHYGPPPLTNHSSYTSTTGQANLSAPSLDTSLGVPPYGDVFNGVRPPGIHSSVSSLPNLSLPPPGYHMHTPSPVISPYISHPVPPPSPVFPIPIPSASGDYVPQASHHNYPPYIPSSVPPTPLSSIPVPSASGDYIPQASHHNYPSYIPSAVPPPTPVSSIPIASASGDYVPQASHNTYPPYNPSTVPPPTPVSSIPIASPSGDYIPQASHNTYPPYNPSPVPPPTPVSSILIPKASDISKKSLDERDSESEIRYKRQSRSRSHENVHKKRSSERDSESEIRYKRQSKSRSHEKVHKKRSSERRHRRSESRSPERKHRKYERSHKKSERSHDRVESNRSRSKSKDRQDISSPKDKLIKRACKSLTSVCDKIGILGHSLRAVLEETEKFRKNSSKIVVIFSDPENQELLLLIAKRLRNLSEETKDEILLSVFTEASIATNLLLKSIELNLETSNSGPESEKSIEHESIYSNDNSSIVNSAYNKKVCEKRSSIEDYSNISGGPSNIIESSTHISFQNKYSEDLTSEEIKLIQRITEGRLDNIRGSEKESASTSGLHIPTAISEMFSSHVDSMKEYPELQNENLSKIQYSSEKFKNGVFKVAIFGHDYVDLLPVSSGRTFQSKTPGISYQVMKYSRKGAEAIKVQNYRIWNKVISAQPNLIFLILGKNDVSGSIFRARDIGNGMLRIKMQLERRIPNVDIVCFGLETHRSNNCHNFWSIFQEELNSFLEAKFSMFISPSTNIDIGAESHEATMSVWFHIQKIIEHVEHQQIMLNKFLPT